MGCSLSNNFLSFYQKHPTIKNEMMNFINTANIQNLSEPGSPKDNLSCKVKSIHYNNDKKILVITLTNLDMTNMHEIFTKVRKDLLARYAGYNIQDEDFEFCARKRSIYDHNNQLVKDLTF